MNATGAVSNDHYDCGNLDGQGFFVISEMIVNVL